MALDNIGLAYYTKNALDFQKSGLGIG